MYTQKRYKTRWGICVEEYHSPRYMPPGEKRQPRKKPTPEQVRKNNQRQRVKKVRLLMLENFSPMDYHTILTYRKEERPEKIEEVKRHLARLIRRLRDWYKKQDRVLKWIATIERGKRGAWHVHIVISRIHGLDVKLAGMWEYGRPRNVLIEDAKGLDHLAAYITKGSGGEDGEQAEESSFSHSRNLKSPKVTKKVYRRWKTWNREKIRIPKGFYLDQDSVDEWIDCLGYMHREYTLYRLQKRRE